MLPLLVVSIAFTLLTSSAALGVPIKCYCNSAQCASDGRYVCTSESGRCFSKLYSAYRAAAAVHPTRLPPDEHGCVDLLPAPQRGMCDGTGDLVKQTEKGNAMIVCCGDELCNYNENQDIRVDSGRSSSSSSRRTGGGASAKEKSSSKATEYSRPAAQDAWFTAAIVCVPIVGGLILVVLVLVAVRMLRSDQRSRSHKHGRGGLARPKLCWADHLPWRQGKRALSDHVHSSDVYKDVSVQVGHWLNGVSVCSLSADSAEVSSSVLVWNDHSETEPTSGAASGTAAAV